MFLMKLLYTLPYVGTAETSRTSIIPINLKMFFKRCLQECDFHLEKEVKNHSSSNNNKSKKLSKINKYKINLIRKFLIKFLI